MLSYEELLNLKEEKLRLERENLRLRGELLALTKSNHGIYTETVNFFELNKKNQENIIQSKLMTQNYNDSEIKEKIKNLKQENQSLQSMILSIKQQDRSKFIQDNKTSKNDVDQKILNENLQLKNIIKSLRIQAKLKLERLKQENEEKDLEIHDLKEQMNQIQSLLKQKKQEMNEKYKEIKSLSEDASLYRMQLESNSNYENNKLNQEISELNSKNESLRCLIYELTQKNDEKESTIKTLKEKNERFNSLFIECKQKIATLIQNKKEIEIKQEDLQSKNQNQIFLLNQQIQQLKDTNQQIKDKFQKKIIRLELDYESKINDLQTEINESTQNLKLPTQIKKLEEINQQQKRDLDNKESLISKLKIIINSNQDKINRMEVENIYLNEQLKIHEDEDQQIREIIQSYKNQKLEINILLKNVNETNHRLKNHICSIILDLLKMTKESQNKDKIIFKMKEISKK